jgi:hypothetical protein
MLTMLFDQICCGSNKMNLLL